MSQAEADYRYAVREYGAAIERLSYAYEADPAERRDLVQEIHLALWRSFDQFDGRCSLRTWVYRVAHNVATSHVIRRQRRRSPALVSLEEAEAEIHENSAEVAVDRERARALLLALIQRLEPLDRQLMLAYLEGLSAEEISEITGLSPANVWTKIHRIKSVLIRRFHKGGVHVR